MKRGLLAISLLLPGIVFGGGFKINTQGIKAMGFGGLSTAFCLDASAVFFNPGAISQLKQNSLTAGFAAMIPSTSYLDPFDGNTDMDVVVSIPFHFYGVYQLNDKLTAGLAINTPFSINTKWNDEWAGRYVSQENRLRTLYVQPTLAYEINSNWSIGAGIVAGWAGTSHRKAVDVSGNTTPFGVADYKNNGAGFGFNGGIYYIYNNFSAGLSYRSMVKFILDNGKVKYTDIPAGANLLQDFPSEANYNSEINMPGALDAGIAWNMGAKFRVTANFSISQWSSDDSINYDFNEHSSLNYSEPVNFKNVVAASLGGQYHHNERTWLRAGLAFEKTPVPDGFVRAYAPDANRISFCGGVSYLWKAGLTLDASIMIQDYKTRIESSNLKDKFNGQYKTTNYIIGIGLSYVL